MGDAPAPNRDVPSVGGIPPEGSGSDEAVFRAAVWAKANVPDLTEAAFINAIRQEQPDFDDRWIATKWRDAGRR